MALPLHLAHALAALSLELLLVATHAKVLLCLGRPFTSSDLASKRWTYFLVDAASPWNSLAALLSSSSSSTASTTTQSSWLPLLVLAAAAHSALHLYYIATWTSRHSSNVLSMSAVQDMRSRWQRFNASQVAWFLVGTSYDIATHAALAALLARQLLGGA